MASPLLQSPFPQKPTSQFPKKIQSLISSPSKNPTIFPKTPNSQQFPRKIQSLISSPSKNHTIFPKTPNSQQFPRKIQSLISSPCKNHTIFPKTPNFQQFPRKIQSLITSSTNNPNSLQFSKNIQSLIPHKPSSQKFPRRIQTLVSSPTNNPTTTSKSTQETVFFDGGAHYGDLLANLLLGFTLLWMPLTIAAVSRAFFLRYRFTDLRVTVISGFTGQDRSDFSYKVIKDVQVVPRFIGEWGDIVITLKDGTVVDLRSVPKFREIAKYCLEMAGEEAKTSSESSKPKGF